MLAALLAAVLVPPGPAGPPMHGAPACDAMCKFDVCREQAKAVPSAGRVNAVAACMTLTACPPACVVR